jgi:nucleoside-diphosphate-sugar epimerase
MSKKIFLTGSSGFVGTNLYKNLKPKFKFTFYKKDKPIRINENIVINLAGKAHDLKKTSNPNEYYEVNTIFSNSVFDAFISSNAKVFITLSSVKAVADKLDSILNEEYIPNPVTHYGKSKLLAEQYILSKELPQGKRVYILRPCMIHGPGNKGNLNLLFKIINKGFPWPLGAFENKRSFCSIDNLCFIINELIENENIPTGIYNIADDIPLSTNKIIRLISQSQGKKTFIWNVPKIFLRYISLFGDILHLPFNTERLSKLTENYVVSNVKIKNAINKPLPVNSEYGLLNTFSSFSHLFFLIYLHFTISK